MKLPAMWIVAAFATGIALAGRWPEPLGVWIATAAAAIVSGGILAWRSRSAFAWGATLLAWLALGGLAWSGARCLRIT